MPTKTVDQRDTFMKLFFQVTQTIDLMLQLDIITTLSYGKLSFSIKTGNRGKQLA